MKIDNVIVKIDPTVATEDDLKKFVTDAKNKFRDGRLSKIVVTTDKDGGFNVNYSVKNQPIFLK